MTESTKQRHLEQKPSASEEETVYAEMNQYREEFDLPIAGFTRLLTDETGVYFHPESLSRALRRLQDFGPVRFAAAKAFIANESPRARQRIQMAQIASALSRFEFRGFDLKQLPSASPLAGSFEAQHDLFGRISLELANTACKGVLSAQEIRWRGSQGRKAEGFALLTSAGNLDVRLKGEHNLTHRYHLLRDLPEVERGAPVQTMWLGRIDFPAESDEAPSRPVAETLARHLADRIFEFRRVDDADCEFATDDDDLQSPCEATDAACLTACAAEDAG